jgi:hypothetical protein
MGGNLVGKLAWAVLGLIGLFTTVDLGFGPIVICPQCGATFNMVIGIILIALSVGAFVMNRGAAPRG